MKITSSLLMLLLAGCPMLAEEEAVPDQPVADWPEEPIPTETVLAHDPVMIREGDTYYLFITGPGITVWASEDGMETWMRRPAVFDPYPAWVPEAIDNFAGHMWAPDIAYVNGRYHLYYSVSAFGKNTSAIGLATNVTLDPESPDYKWVDHGKLIQSYPGVTDYNAIDAQYIEDDDGTPYLAFGSFWSGLKILQMTPDGMNLAECWQDPWPLASRSYEGRSELGDGQPAVPGEGGVEAPFIFKKGEYFYLFASFDLCCRGPKSTYKVVVGRAPHLLGPYHDKDGVSMLEGGGTVILKGDEDWYAVGHNSVYEFDGTDYIIFHGYEAVDERGLPRLRIEKFEWDKEGWPFVRVGCSK